MRIAGQVVFFPTSIFFICLPASLSLSGNWLFSSPYLFCFWVYAGSIFPAMLSVGPRGENGNAAWDIQEGKGEIHGLCNNTHTHICSRLVSNLLPLMDLKGRWGVRCTMLRGLTVLLFKEGVSV